MTVESTQNKAGPFNVTGTSITIPRNFLVLDEDHLRVIRVRDGIESDLTAGVGHTGIGDASGTVVISAGLQAGDKIYLLRAVPNLQRSDYNAQGRVRTDQVEDDLDLLQMQIQDVVERQGRALTLSVSTEIDGEEALQAAIEAPAYASQAREYAEQAAGLLGGVIDYSPLRVVMKLSPDIPERDGDPTWFPPTGAPYLNVIIGADGPADDAMVSRSTLVGNSVATLADQAFDRVEAFGDGAVRFADYLDSVTAIGSLSYRWLGLQPEAGEDMDDALARTIHDFVTDKPLSDPTWNYAGLETNNPGLRAKLLAVAPATTKADNKENVGLGRNAGLNIIKGARNTIIGKNAMAHGYYAINNAMLGWNAFRNGALVWRSVGIGARAGMLWSEGTDNTVIGDGAGANINSGSLNIIIGQDAASSYTGLQNDLLWIGSNNRPALTGNLFQRKFGFNVVPEGILGKGLHVRVGTSAVTGGSVNSGADGLVVEKSGANTGITILTDNNRFGQLIFADPQDNNVGGIQYNHATDEMFLKAGDQTRLILNSDGLRALGLPTSASGLTAGQIWNDNGTLKVA